MPMEARTEARNLPSSTLGSTSYWDAIRFITAVASASETVLTVSSSSATDRNRSSGPTSRKMA